ncbi:MAG: hypothetical protein ACK5H2_12545 [Beutenbergiaceae bacterium]
MTAAGQVTIDELVVVDDAAVALGPDGTTTPIEVIDEIRSGDLALTKTRSG